VAAGWRRVLVRAEVEGGVTRPRTNETALSRSIQWVCSRCNAPFERYVRPSHRTPKFCSVQCSNAVHNGSPEMRAASSVRIKPRLKHGDTDSPEHCAWKQMKQRCRPGSVWRRWYAARGIVVCDEWRQSYEAFRDHIGPRPSPKHSLDRINNDGNYEPGNVRWATWAEQMLNRRKPRRRAA